MPTKCLKINCLYLNIEKSYITHNFTTSDIEKKIYLEDECLIEIKSVYNLSKLIEKF